MHDVVLGNAENALAEQFRGRHQVGVHVLDALGVAGRARGVEPEGDFVRQRLGGEGLRIGGGDDVVKRMHLAAVEPGHVVGGVDDDDGFQLRKLFEDRPDRLRERRRDDQRRRAAVGQNVGVLRQRQIDVERDRDAAGADRAPEGDRIVDGVVEQQRDALLGLNPEIAQRVGEADAARLQLAVGQRALGIDEGDLVAAPGRDVGIDEIGNGVVGPALGEDVHPRPPCSQLSNSRVSRRRASTPATRRR